MTLTITQNRSQTEMPVALTKIGELNLFLELSSFDSYY